MDFKEAIGSGHVREVRKIPKADLHHHFLMGGRLRDLGKKLGLPIPAFGHGHRSIHDINRWIMESLRPVFMHPEAFEKAVEAAFIQARSDGITVLESSMDVCFGKLFNIPPHKIIFTLERCHRDIVPGLDFRPEIGIPRNLSVRTILSCLEPYLDSGFFRAVDLYDDETAQPIGNFREIYRLARKHGMRCKAHAGEFGDADSVKEAVQILELDAVQHGIAAAGSPAVMKWLADHHITLNVCPSSNIQMKRTRSYRSHPIRILYDHGVRVTVNTDDVILFNTGVSEQFLGLYRAGTFTLNELDRIRVNGLE